jgi:uncharacterized protein
VSILSISLIFFAIGIGSLVKGITGLGLPVIALPVLTFFLGLPHAIGVLLVPIMVTNLIQAVQMRAAWGEVRFLRLMLVAAAPGIALGTWVLVVLSAEMLMLGLAAVLFIYIGVRVLSPQVVIRHATAVTLAPFVGLLMGFVQGATGLCAAVFVPFLHAIGLERAPMILIVSLAFLVLSVVQLIALVTAGLFQPVYLLEGALALVPVALFMPLGNRLGRRLPRAVFDRIFLVVLGIIGVGLVQGALR